MSLLLLLVYYFMIRRLTEHSSNSNFYKSPKKQRIQEEMANNEIRPESVPIIPESNLLQESDLSYTIQGISLRESRYIFFCRIHFFFLFFFDTILLNLLEMANKWDEETVSLSMQLWGGEGSWDK